MTGERGRTVIRLDQPAVVSYGIVWYGMVWYGMVWYGMVWPTEHNNTGRKNRYTQSQSTKSVP